MIIHAFLPSNIDDPLLPSGGNVYDRRLLDGLRGQGFAVAEHVVAGDWPHPAPAALHGLGLTLAGLPDGALVLLDGLVASAAPSVLVPQAPRLRLVVLMHLPIETPDEAAVLSGATLVVATSQWCRSRLIELYGLPPGRVVVATPGVDGAPLAPGSTGGNRLLCVAAVTHHKGHDILLAALHRLRDLAWDCVCVGTLDREPAFAASLRGTRGGALPGASAASLRGTHGVALPGASAASLRGTHGPSALDRVTFTGALPTVGLAEQYAQADLLVHPSRGETYGMVVTEALARGLPVVASATQGLPEALGRAADGARPGLLVPPDDAPALAAALRQWLTDPALRERLRAAARDRRDTLRPWSATTDAVVAALDVHSGR